MADAVKHPPGGSVASELRGLISVLRTRKTRVFAGGFVLTFVACTVFIAFNPTYGSGSPWLNNIFSSAAPVRSQFDSIFSFIFSNSSSSSSSSSPPPPPPSSAGEVWGFGAPPSSSVSPPPPPSLPRSNQGAPSVASPVKNQTSVVAGSPGNGVAEKNQTKEGVASGQGVIAKKNQTGDGAGFTLRGEDAKNETKNVAGGGSPAAAILAPPPKNQTSAATLGVAPPPPSTTKTNATASAGIPQKAGPVDAARVSNSSVSLSEGTEPGVGGGGGGGAQWSIHSMVGCDLFHGRWVKDESYPLYKAGSCPHVDESFDCYRNGRPDAAYQKLRWQPSGCSIPRLNGTDMLERLRGRRLVFVGDSLNRNMWESLVCILRSSIEDKSKVFEASGKHEFRTEGSYSFRFKDYNCSVEFFRSPFLVQEWETPDSAGKKKETLRLDIIEKSSARYRDADVIVFNTGHWWTHEKTSKGKDYYQEGNRVYGELKVIEAFHKALSTWARWVDANIDPLRSLVFFRGYSASHFSGGRWNSGGQCHRETEPIRNESYLSSYPPKMSVLESVIQGMKTPVAYLNITRMTDYRKDGHPSVYRKRTPAAAERHPPDHFQDCSHWCLPGVPDSWNELLYAQLLLKLHQRRP